MESPVARQDGGVEAESKNKPDVMNDPAYDTNVKNKQSSSEEADTCRICRGEGSQEEPLFYPCKCSGSIKFVHQNCLMEWLSHSQKKHCELCKTPFHFTKLYHPHMPDTVPLPIFFRQAAVHTWKSVVTSSRLLFVMFVWAVWLPWCMRTIWRGLFWIGDGAWADWTERKLQNENKAFDLSARLAMEGTSPAQQGLLVSDKATASVIISQISSQLPHFIPPIRQIFNFSTGQPWGLVLLKKAYYYLSGRAPNLSSPSASAPADVTSHAMPDARSSWLSDFEFLKTLTPSTTLNNMVIDTLEGQLITLFVVIAFILLFLIREWVVQQQPIINGGIDIDAQAPVAQNLVAPAQQQLNDQVREPPGGEDNVEAVDEGFQLPGPRARMIARARARRPRAPRPLSEQEGIQPDDDASTAVTNASEAERMEAESLHSIRPNTSSDHASTPTPSDLDPDHLQRPGMPDRDTLARAAEIRRTLEELSQVSDAPDSAMEVFKDFWDRAGREPLEVINIIEREGRSAELSWIVAAMAKIEGLRQGMRSARASMSSMSANEVSKLTGGNQPEDDEGFTLINRPSLSRGPESPTAGNADLEALRRPNPRPSAPPPMATSHEGSSLPTSPSSIRNTKSVKDDLRDTREDHSTAEILQGTQTAQSSSGSQDPIDSDAPIMPNDLDDHARDNPFHLDYEGELLGGSSFAHGVATDEEYLSPPEVQQSAIELEQASNGQTRSPPILEVPAHSRTIVETVSNWLWGGIAPLPATQEQPAGDDEHVVRNIAEEEPFVPVDHGQPLRLAANDGAVANQDPEVIAAALQAGIDPNEADAVDDMEDLEGILELVGMQGPLAGLVQNGMFCACLVSLTILFGVWIPYVSGKIFLVLLAHPFSLLFRIPLRWAASTADTVIDICTFCAGCAFYWTDTIVGFLCTPLGWLIPPFERMSQNKTLAEAARAYAERALDRLAKSFVATGDVLSEADIPMFSVTAHESLRSIESRIAWVLQVMRDNIPIIINSAHNSSGLLAFLRLSASSILDYTRSLAVFITERFSATMTMWSSLLQINPLRVNLGLPQRTLPIDYDLANWNIKDRALAVGFGYLFFAVLGVLYLRLNAWMKGTNKAGRVSGVVADGLYQAGGVMKVVLIIGIEMIVFPLYCGLLLDVALLPLFGHVTIMSRVNFTMASPNTSLFVHWFVGTCYMFHFALFVSMCRKILRSGVLCTLTLTFCYSRIADMILQTSSETLMTQRFTLSVTFLSEACPLNYGKSLSAH